MTSLSGDLEKGKVFSMLYIVLPGVYVTHQAVEAGVVERKGITFPLCWSINTHVTD